MEWKGFTVQCPLVLGGSVSEAEVLGASVWLWMHSARHKNAPLEALATMLLPAIKERQYVLAHQEGKPVFFMSWAWFDEDAEQRYLTRLPLPQENDWRCGNRMWAIDLVAPFGHTRQMINLVLSELFPEHCFRALWHRGRERGKRVKHFRGYRVSRLALQDWQTAHPLCADVQECGLPGGRE